MGLFDKIKSAASSALGDANPFKTSSAANETAEDTYIPPYRQAAYQEVNTAPAPVAAQPAASVGGGMYDPALEKLIEIALADGELTEKEKQILFKRAEAMGVDLDEFEMVLEARLFEKGQQIAAQKAAAAAAAPAPASNKHGSIKKCPACGAVVPPFTAKCVECGLEFNVAETTQSIERLFEMLNQVESESTEDAKGLLGGLSQAMGQSFSMDGGKTIRRKKSIIQNFPIPTSKNDILEFLTLAVPQAKYKTFMGTPVNDSSDPERYYLGPVWKAKCEQIIIKAKFALKDDKETLDIIKQYADELKIKF